MIARRVQERAVAALAALAMVATASVFLLIGAIELLKELGLPAWLAIGAWGGLGALAALILVR